MPLSSGDVAIHVENQSFVSRGERIEVALHSLDQPGLGFESFGARRSGRAPTAARATPMMAGVRAVLGTAASRFRVVLDHPGSLARVEIKGRQASRYDGIAMTLATDMIIVEGARRADLEFAIKEGVSVLDEGLDGKALLRAETANHAFAVMQKLSARNLGAVSPNFLRVVSKQKRQAARPAWAYAKIGVEAAWRISKGSSGVRIAVLDEGVDTEHPAIKLAVVDQKDFVGGNGASALPSGDDAHGTACAGIIVSRDRTYPGIAPKCSLLAARIAMDDGSGNWVFDDWSTAEAIDWAWRAEADILSNSWGGGPPSDAISRAFGRAHTQGRKGKGTVVVIAAGNAEAPIGFPGDLPGYLTVGASTPKDERKTKTSSDGEDWWGSNFGPTLSLLAPGVFIRTCDIHGARGYSPGAYTDTFNGTSAAAPHVAATAALMLGVNPGLTASQVSDIIQATAALLPKQKGRTDENGWGRLDIAAAVTKAAGSAPNAEKGPKKPGGRKSKPVRRAA